MPGDEANNRLHRIEVTGFSLFAYGPMTKAFGNYA